MGGAAVRFLVGLIAYVIGMSVLVSVGIAGIMALRSPPMERAPAEFSKSTASSSERPASGTKQRANTEAKPQHARKNKLVREDHKRTYPALNSGNGAYGYAEEPRRRFDPNPFLMFGR
jgi:hypothetical protein